MKKILVILMLLSTAANAEVLAVVNGKEISREEIDKALAGVEWAEGGKASISKFPVDIQLSFVEKFIERKLVLEQAEKSGLANDKDVKEKLQAAREYLLQQKYLQNLVANKKTLVKLKELYKEKYSSKEGKQEVSAKHILVKTKEEAEDIIKRLNKAENFEKLAKEKSIDPGAKVNGGDLGYFSPEDMVPEFSKAAFALEKGKTSAPVKSQFGWHIIKVIDKKTTKPPSFMEAKAELEQMFAANVIKEKVSELKSQAKIEYKIAPEKTKKAK